MRSWNRQKAEEAERRAVAMFSRFLNLWWTNAKKTMHLLEWYWVFEEKIHHCRNRDLIKYVVSYGFSWEFFKIKEDIFGGIAIPLEEYIALIIKEVYWRIKARVVEGIWHHWPRTSPWYDCRDTGKEYLIIRDLVSKVFYDITRYWEKNIAKDDSSTNLLVIHLYRKKESNCRFFSKIPACKYRRALGKWNFQSCYMIRRIFWNDTLFKKNQEPMRMMRCYSILSHFPKEDKGIRCLFKNPGNFAWWGSSQKQWSNILRQSSWKIIPQWPI